MFSVLHGTNATSGKNSGFQKRTRIHSHFNNYINCRNHRLALHFPPWFWFITFWSLENVSLFTIKMRNIEKNSVNLWQKIIENYKSGCNTLADTWGSFSTNIRLLIRFARSYWSRMPRSKRDRCQGLLMEGRIIFYTYLAKHYLLLWIHYLYPLKSKQFYWLM